MLLVLLGVLSATAPVAAHWADVVAPLASGLLRLEIGDLDASGSCSGIVLHADAGFILTAAHCVPLEADTASITVADRDAVPVKVNRRLDLAVLKTRLRTEATNVPLAPAMPRAGSAVAVLGYPFGARSLTLQVGVVANPDVDGWAWINADLLPGDSGGAIVDAEGRLVALTSGVQFAGAAHMGRAVPIDTIRAFVDEFLPGPK